MSARSMTGFSRVRRTAGAYDATVSVRSVNHRGLDVHFRMPPDLDPFEPVLRAVVKRQVARGHLQVQVRYTSTREAGPGIVNEPLLRAYLDAFRRMSALHNLSTPPDLNEAFRIPGMFDTPEEEPDPALGELLSSALIDALLELNIFREREGAEIAADMRARTNTIIGSVRQMEAIRTRAVPEFHTRLADKLGELLKNTAIDQQRLAQEVAYLVDRTDISEELTRLNVHAAQLHDILEAGGEIGKKIDFLLQEMHRETNTILSKSTGVGESGLAITELALGAKAEIEKIREQGLNLE